MNDMEEGEEDEMVFEKGVVKTEDSMQRLE